MQHLLDTLSPSDRVSSITQLEALYGEPHPQSITKEIDYISDHYQAFIEKAPFAIIATSGPEGLDCSPRGDLPGFVRVHDHKTVLLPDRRGNNRIDTLRNIVRDPRVSLLFLIPGIGETLRINGRAEIVTDPELCASLAMNSKEPRTVVVISVDTVYFQCPKALVRSGLWKIESQIPRTDLPSTGKMLQALADDNFDGAAYDKNYPERLKQTIY